MLRRLRTSVWRYLLWPPRVLIAVNFPAFAQRVTVFGSTLKSDATSEGVKSTSLSRLIFDINLLLNSSIEGFALFAPYERKYLPLAQRKQEITSPALKLRPFSIASQALHIPGQLRLHRHLIGLGVIA